jgi:hypothetical protein
MQPGLFLGGARMALTETQIRLAVSIDRHVQQTLTSGGGGEALLVSMYDHMGSFKQLLDTCSPKEMDSLCERYAGFHRFARLLENLAQGISDGTIAMPE